MSQLIVSGLNYHSAPIAVREQFSIPDSCLQHALISLASLPNVHESVVLSTCNRMEVYAVVTDAQAGLREISAFLSSAQAVQDHQVLKPNFKLLGDDVALHLFRVASGLDSMILGDGQILAQMKKAHQTALLANTAGQKLNHLFQTALYCGKRVRTETKIGRRAVSVSSAALELGRELLGGLKQKSVLVLGAGKMAQMCLKQLSSDATVGNIMLVNRNKERVLSLQSSASRRGNKTPIRVFDFEDRYALAAAADLVIVATSSSQFVLLKKELEAKRPGSSKPLFVIDISVPRNVDPAIGEIEGVQLFHADNLAEIVRTNLAERQALIGDAERIVFEMLDEFHHWQRSLLVVPVISSLKDKLESIRQGESGRASCESEQVSQAIVRKILHHPAMRMKTVRDEATLLQEVEFLKKLFDLAPKMDSGAAPAGHNSEENR